MNLFQSVTGNLTKAVDFVVEKNRKAALINRIRIVIKNERENEARAYVALGKYYYEHLRDKNNEETEHLCRAVDFSDARIRKAFQKMDELTEPEGCDDDSCTDCGDYAYCPYIEENDESPVAAVQSSGSEAAAPSVQTIIEKANEAEQAVPASAFADAVEEEAAEDEPVSTGV